MKVKPNLFVVRSIMLDSTVYGSALDTGNEKLRSYSYACIKLVEQGIVTLGSSKLIFAELMDTPEETVRKGLSELYQKLNKIELAADVTVTSLADKYLEKLKKVKLEVPKVDVLLISLCSKNEVNALISLNRRHLVNEGVQKCVESVNSELGFKTPVIMTPEQLIKDGKYSLASRGVLFGSE